MKRAFLFDLNGTMIDDMRYHLDVWFTILTAELGATLTRDEVRSHMYGKNQEVLGRIFGPHRFSVEEADRISQNKEERYQELYRPEMRLLPGLAAFLERTAHHRIPMAIGSAASPFNINFVLDHLNIHHFFRAVVSADDVLKSKPHPETFLKAADALGATPEQCIVFEDAPKGVECAGNAGMKAIVLTTTHSREEFASYDNVLLFTPDYHHAELQSFFGD